MLLRSKKEAHLYAMLQAQANVAHRTAQTFVEMVEHFPDFTGYAEKISELEHEGDELTHDFQNRIAATFITPIDKEDLKELSQALDDVTDFIEAAAARAELYRVGAARPELLPLAEILVKSTAIVETAIGEMHLGLRKSKKLQQHLMDIHTLENESDRMFRTALSNLFHEPGVDALTVIKWKELFDRIETAVDKCEHIAAILGTILIKYA